MSENCPKPDEINWSAFGAPSSRPPGRVTWADEGGIDTVKLGPLRLKRAGKGAWVLKVKHAGETWRLHIRRDRKSVEIWIDPGDIARINGED